jgi:hypothetical protein
MDAAGGVLAGLRGRGAPRVRRNQGRNVGAAGPARRLNKLVITSKHRTAKKASIISRSITMTRPDSHRHVFCSVILFEARSYVQHATSLTSPLNHVSQTRDIKRRVPSSSSS